MSDLYLATASPEWEQRVRDAFGGTFPGDIGSWSFAADGVDPVRAVAEIAQLGVSVVVVGPDLPEDTALDLCARVDAAHPEVCVLLVAPPDPELFQRALRSGVRDIVDPHGALLDIRGAIDRAMGTARRRRENVASATTAIPASA